MKPSSLKRRSLPVVSASRVPCGEICVAGPGEGYGQGCIGCADANFTRNLVDGVFEMNRCKKQNGNETWGYRIRQDLDLDAFRFHRTQL